MVEASQLIEDGDDLVALVVFLTIGGMLIAGVLGLNLLGGVILILGFAVVLPLVGVFGDRLVEQLGEDAPRVDPLDELRGEYARGEIDHEEFERRVERLLETEDVEPGGPEATLDRELEREPE